MERVRPYLVELTRALMVLALVLLNLAPQSGPAVAFDGFGFTASTVVNCGFTDEPSQPGHAPCHACRIGGDVALPPPPCHGEPADLASVEVVYRPVAAHVQPAPGIIANRSRGPPAGA